MIEIKVVICSYQKYTKYKIGKSKFSFEFNHSTMFQVLYIIKRMFYRHNKLNIDNPKENIVDLLQVLIFTQ